MPITGATPLPPSGTVCGLPAALSAMLSVAERVPVAVGLNVTLTGALRPGAMSMPVVAGTEKSAALVPVIEKLEMCRFAVPLFVISTGVAALLVPTNWFPKFRLLGLRLMLDPNAVPERETV